jgi:hypothetical protein
MKRLSDVVKFNESNLLVLASGGQLLAFDGYRNNETVWCLWEDDDGVVHRDWYPACVLRRLVKFEVGDF